MFTAYNIPKIYVKAEHRFGRSCSMTVSSRTAAVSIITGVSYRNRNATEHCFCSEKVIDA